MKSSTLNDIRIQLAKSRNRVIGDPRFQHWAARFPLTRSVARRRAAGLFDLVAGFVHSQTLAACVETGLLDALLEGPCALDDVAARVGLPEEGTERLLKAATALGLAQRVAGGWMLGSQGAALRANPGIAAMVRHHRLLYADLADPVAALRHKGGGQLAAFWAYGETGTDSTAYSDLMSASQAMIAEQVADAHDFAKHRRLLDVGGGSGSFARAIARRFPSVACTVYDLPDVAKKTGGIGGDFLRGPLPGDFDAMSLVRVLHDHDDSAAIQLLRNIAGALPGDGSLILAEPMAGTRGGERAGDSYFGLYLWAMGAGRPRTFTEIRSMLREAGFGRVREKPTALPLLCRVVHAEKA